MFKLRLGSDTKTTWFGFRKASWSGLFTKYWFKLVVTNMARDATTSLEKTSGFCQHKYVWKHPEVSVTTSSSSTLTNAAMQMLLSPDKHVM